MTWRPSDLSAAIPHATSSRTTAPCPPSSLTRIDAVPSEAVESLVPWCGWHGVQGGQDLNRPHGHRHGNATNLVDIPERGCGVVWVVQAGRGMVRGHDQPSGSTTAQPAVGPHPAPAAAPRGGVPRHVPDRNCVAALLFMARTSTPWNLLPAKELGCGSATTCWRRLDEWARAGCSSSSRRCCWTNWARPAASTWSGLATPRPRSSPGDRSSRRG
jgi:hypothetical protein